MHFNPDVIALWMLGCQLRQHVTITETDFQYRLGTPPEHRRQVYCRLALGELVCREQPFDGAQLSRCQAAIATHVATHRPLPDTHGDSACFAHDVSVPISPVSGEEALA